MVWIGDIKISPIANGKGKRKLGLQAAVEENREERATEEEANGEGWYEET